MVTISQTGPTAVPAATMGNPVYQARSSLGLYRDYKVYVGLIYGYLNRAISRLQGIGFRVLGEMRSLLQKRLGYRISQQGGRFKVEGLSLGFCFQRGWKFQGLAEDIRGLDDGFFMMTIITITLLLPIVCSFLLCCSYFCYFHCCQQ